MRRKRVRATIAALCCMGLVGGGIGANVAVAKITPANCENNGGNLPPGQQPVCQGGGLTQNPALNPAGHAPPGQQP